MLIEFEVVMQLFSRLQSTVYVDNAGIQLDAHTVGAMG